jgi:hypothetical protein
MTRADLISSLYRHFKKMHALWMDLSRARGVGALIFFSEDYERAGDFSELRWEFWEREQLLSVITEGVEEDVRLKLGEEDFLTRMNDTEFLSVVVRDTPSDDRFEFEIHRIDGAILN